MENNALKQRKNDDRKYPYKTYHISKTTVGRFRIVKDEIVLDGKVYPYSYEEVDDCVCILPIIVDEVILIKQYRHAFNEWFLEIPAGGINGEEPEVAARRELIEEIGYEADELIYRGVYPVSQGTSTARAHFFIAKCGKYVGTNLEPTELIEPFRCKLTEIDELIQSGQFNHLVGIALWHLYNSGGKE